MSKNINTNDIHPSVSAQVDLFLSYISSRADTAEDLKTTLDSFFEEAKNCHKAYTKIQIKDKTKKKKTYYLKPNQKKLRLLFALYEDEIREQFIDENTINDAFFPLDDEEKKGNLKKTLEQIISYDDIEVAEWLSKLDMKTLRFFARDELVNSKVNKLAQIVHSNSSNQTEHLLSFEQNTYKPQVSSVNPLIPISERNNLLEEKGLFQGEIIVHSEGETIKAYLSEDGRPLYDQEITVDGKTLSTGIYNVIGYLNNNVLSFPSGDNSSTKPRQFCESNKRTLTGIKWKAFINFFSKKEIEEREGLVLNPNDYAFGDPTTREEKLSFEALPNFINGAESEFLSELFTILLNRDVDSKRVFDDTIFSGDPSDILAKLSTPHIAEKKSLFFALLMQPELQDIAKMLTKEDQDSFKKLLGKILTPLLENPDRLDQMRQVSHAMSEMSQQDMLFFISDPNLSDYVRDQVASYLNYKGASQTRSYKAYFEEDPRLSLINPLIPKRIRNALKEDIKIKTIDFKILDIYDRSDLKEIRVKDLDDDTVKLVHYQMTEKRLHPGDRIKTTLVEKTVGSEKRLFVSLSKETDTIKKYKNKAIAENKSLEELFTETKVERRFSLFDHIDPDLKSIERQANSLSNHVPALILDPHHLLGQAVKHVSSFEDGKINTQILEDIDYILPIKAGDKSRKNLVDKIRHGKSGLFAFYNPQNERTFYYWIAKNAFETTKDRIFRLCGGHISYDEMDQESAPSAFFDVFEKDYSLALLTSPYIQKRIEDISNIGNTLKQVSTCDNHQDHVYAKTFAMTKHVLHTLKSMRTQDRNALIGRSDVLLSTHPVFSDLRTYVGLTTMPQTDLINGENLKWDAKNINDFYIAAQIINDAKQVFSRFIRNNDLSSDNFQNTFQTYVARKTATILKKPKKSDLTEGNEIRAFPTDPIKKCIFEARNQFVCEETRSATATIKINAANDDKDTMFVFVLSPKMNAEEKSLFIAQFNEEGMKTIENTLDTGETEIIVKRPNAKTNKSKNAL